MPEPRQGGHWYQRGIRTLQLLSIVLMWTFLGAIVTWVLNMVHVSRSLGDSLTASVGISLVAIPVYSLVAGILTYVYFGIQLGRRRSDE
jgi:O-antigen/teichoic acid export membrane protein